MSVQPYRNKKLNNYQKSSDLYKNIKKDFLDIILYEKIILKRYFS
jgi:hypothetical protein